MNISVSIPCRELSLKLPYYLLISDCLDGEQAVKIKGAEYLPVPNSDEETDTSQRYKDYLKRAVFYNVTYKTLAGITGMVYLKDANYKLPELLKTLDTDCTGEGISLPQLSKRALQFGLSFGRAGLFVDYPFVENAATMDDIQSGAIQPVMRLYEPINILKWRVRSENGKVVLCLVVLKEGYKDDSDEFLDVVKFRYRVLRLTPNPITGKNEFTVEIIEETDWESEGIITPLDSKGMPFDFIPFYFIGAENNDSNIDHPPLYDLSVLNIAHYRNSADYEESVFTVGQPMLAYSGVTQEWNDNVLGGKIRLGSRGGLPLPEGGKAEILQVQPNSLAMEAMRHKEEQMLALGAKLIQQSVSNRKTATENNNETASETSILVNVAKNVSDAFTSALKCACKYVGANESEVEFALQADASLVKIDPQRLLALVKSWQDGAISRTEMRYNLRNEGLAHGDEQTQLDEIDKELAEKQSLLDKQMQQKQNVGAQNA